MNPVHVYVDKEDRKRIKRLQAQYVLKHNTTMTMINIVRRALDLLEKDVDFVE